MLLFVGIFTKVNQQKDPNAPPVPEPDNGEERLQLLKKEVREYTFDWGYMSTSVGRPSDGMQGLLLKGQSHEIDVWVFGLNGQRQFI